jgi:hypothetical protein
LSDAPEDPQRDDRDEPQEGAALWVLPYIEDSSLWPVLAVVVAALAAFLTPILLLATRHLDLRGIVATALAVFATFRAVRWEWRLRGRPGGLAAALLVVWGLAIGALVYGTRTGLL